MRVRVDPQRCQGHMLCSMRAPDLFALSDIDGHATAARGPVPSDRQEAVRAAAGSCPEQAIAVLEPGSCFGNLSAADLRRV